MLQIKNHCDFFICQRGPSDQYDHGITRSGLTYDEIYEIQNPERLERFDVYIHMNCNPDVAWKRICDDEGKDRYEYPEYFERQVVNTKKLYDRIVHGDEKSLDFLRKSKNYYIDTTSMTIEEVFGKALKLLEE